MCKRHFLNQVKRLTQRSKVIMQATSSDKKSEPTPIFINRKEDGHLYVDELSVKDIASVTGYSPFYLTSKS